MEDIKYKLRSPLLNTLIKEFLSSLVFILFYVPLDTYSGCSRDFGVFFLSILTTIVVDAGTEGAVSNPSVSVAQWSVGSISTEEFAVSVVAQLIGGFVGMPIVQAFVCVDISMLAPDVSESFGLWELFLESLLGVYLLGSMLLEYMAIDSRLSCLLDSTLYVMCSFACSSIGVAGACLNPMYAVVTSAWSGLLITEISFTKLAYRWCMCRQLLPKYIAVYILGPTLGAVLAATLWTAIEDVLKGPNVISEIKKKS